MARQGAIINAGSTGNTAASTTRMVVSLSIALVSAAAVSWWFRHQRHQRANKGIGGGDGKSASSSLSSSSKEKRILDEDDVRKLPLGSHFLECVERIRHSTKGLTTGDKLVLYGLYKQVLLGDAPSSPPSLSLNFLEDQAKWNAWTHMRGMHRQDAMLRYIAFVTEHMQQQDSESCDDDDDSNNSDPATSGFAPHVSRLVDESDNGEEDEGGDGDDDLNQNWSAKLLRAASNGDAASLRRILESKQVSVNYVDDSGQTALHLAADRGSLDCVKVLLLEHQADVHASDMDGISVLQAAVISGRVEICRLLLEHGANPDQEDMDGDTPRSCAADDGSDEMQQLFQQ